MTNISHVSRKQIDNPLAKRKKRWIDKTKVHITPQRKLKTGQQGLQQKRL